MNNKCVKEPALAIHNREGNLKSSNVDIHKQVEFVDENSLYIYR